MNSELQLVKSPHLVIRKIGDEYLVYNSLFGNPLVINQQCFDALNIFQLPVSLSEVEKTHEIENFLTWVRRFRKNHYLIRKGSDERKQLEKIALSEISKIASGSQLASLSLILSENCNLACPYCVSRGIIEACKDTLPNQKQETILASNLWPA